MTVKELIEALEKLPPDLPVGVSNSEYPGDDEITGAELTKLRGNYTSRKGVRLT